MKSITIAAVLLSALSSPSLADTVEGTWKRPNGILVKVAACGQAFCLTAASGPHVGGKAGSMKSDGKGGYFGRLTDLETGKTYDGKGMVKGNSATLSGCVLFGVICSSETWARQ